ncbi:hypothetical protein DIPPA_24285 [Diplonema papillatum]|nr:hypothetical protein DIPPA_24285 [Diplonema papillatum]
MAEKRNASVGSAAPASETSAEEPELSTAQRFMKYLLTPGSSLTPFMQTLMNIIFAIVFGVLASMLFIEPDNIHYYVMLALLLGLTMSTNWFFALVLAPDAEFTELTAESREPSLARPEESKKDK